MRTRAKGTGDHSQRSSGCPHEASCTLTQRKKGHRDGQGVGWHSEMMVPHLRWSWQSSMDANNAKTTPAGWKHRLLQNHFQTFLSSSADGTTLWLCQSEQVKRQAPLPNNSWVTAPR